MVALREGADGGGQLAVCPIGPVRSGLGWSLCPTLGRCRLQVLPNRQGDTTMPGRQARHPGIVIVLYRAPSSVAGDGGLQLAQSLIVRASVVVAEDELPAALQDDANVRPCAAAVAAVGG